MIGKLSRPNQAFQARRHGDPGEPEQPRGADVSASSGRCHGRGGALRGAGALQAGSIVVARPLPSYREMARGQPGTDPAALINWACTDYKRLSRKYENLREQLLQRFLPSTNVLRGQETLEFISG